MERERTSVEVIWKGEKRRRFVECGHLFRERNRVKNFCYTCWEASPKQKEKRKRARSTPKRKAKLLAAVKRYQKTEKGKANVKLNASRGYYRRYLVRGSAALALGTIIPGNKAETQRRLKLRSQRNVCSKRKFRTLWGNIDYHFSDRFHHELGRELGLHSKAEVQEYIRVNGSL